MNGSRMRPPSSRPSSTRARASTLKLGQARGIALLVPAQAGFRLRNMPQSGEKVGGRRRPCGQEPDPRHDRVLLPRCKPHSDDSADALAVAITHAHHRGRQALARRSRRRADDRQTQRHRRFLRRRLGDHRRRRGRLSGAVFGEHAGSLPGKGEAVSLATETYVREDQLRLFGFGSDHERDWFRLSAHGAGRWHQGGAGDPVDPQAERPDERGRHAGQGAGGAGARASGRRWRSASSPN